MQSQHLVHTDWWLLDRRWLPFPVNTILNRPLNHSNLVNWKERIASALAYGTI
jgi:hypothetical protein